jgi:hypothetical protein
MERLIFYKFNCEYSVIQFSSEFQPIKNQKIHWRSLEGLPNRSVLKQISSYCIENYYYLSVFRTYLGCYNNFVNHP